MSQPTFLDPTSDDQQLLAQVINYYHATLQASPDALAYLQSRGITNSQAIEQFRIGYADRTLGLKLPSKQARAGKELRGRLQQLGLFRAHSGHEHFNGCVVFPICAGDGTGRIVDLYGRRTHYHGLGKDVPRDMYLTSERRGVWNIEALAATEEIIICPSIFDALVFWCQGYRNVTCTLGADALTDDHLAAFQEFKIKRVLLVAESIAPRLREAGLECFVVRLPLGQSIESYARQMQDQAEALAALLRQAQWLGQGKAPSAVTIASLTPESTKPADTQPEPVPLRTASPLPPAPQEVEAEVKEDEVTLRFGNRRYRIRGWSKNLSFDQLKVNVLTTNDTGMFVDTFDLYSAKHRKTFISQAAEELSVEEQTIKKDMGRILLKLEELQDQNIAKALAPKEITPAMSEEEQESALQLLRDPHLLDRIVADLDLVGEGINKAIAYLAAISRKLDDPLAVIIQSSSAAGKTALMDAVLSLVPPEDLVKFSAMTGQSLFYMGETNLKHKILAIVEEEGAERASYALKLLQSEGELTIASTGKDASTGRLVAQEYRVSGPVTIFLTTTAIKIDEELLNRCIVLTVDEDRDQTKAIHQRQRHKQTLAGLLSQQDRQQTLALHRNAQRLLKPLLVVNPHAEQLTFLDDRTRTRRDHAKYLALIRAVALLHQHQRPIKTIEHQGKQVEYIEATLDDIEVANRLAQEALGRSLDELPPQTRRLLTLIDELVTQCCQQQGLEREDYRFSRRQVREYTGWGYTQLQVHLRRLVEMEYLLVHRGGRGRSFAYELLYEAPLLQHPLQTRLLNVARLRHNLAGANGQLSG
jgi:hypothetical protein